uniref:Cyclin B n=1 Tax=Acrobeloides nanus TaxID=290746 RepID=A0A914E7A7_9BILA
MFSKKENGAVKGIGDNDNLKPRRSARLLTSLVSNDPTENLQIKNGAAKAPRIGLALRRHNPLVDEKNIPEKLRLADKPAPLISTKPYSFHDLRFGGGSTLVSVDFAEDIDQYLRYLEKVRQIEPDFLNGKNIDGRMRQILVDWMIQVQQRFQLCSETLQLSVATLDRVLGELSVSKDNLQLLGVTCMFIAAKFEEIYVPNIQDFVYIAANIFTKKDVLRMEGKVLHSVGFQLCTPYTIQFLRKYRAFMNNDSSLHNLAKLITEVALLDYSLAHILPSKVAATSLYLAGRMLQMELPAHMFEVMKVSENEIVELAKKFVHPIRQWTSKSAKLQTILKSYEKLCATSKATILPIEAFGDLLSDES